MSDMTGVDKEGPSPPTHTVLASGRYGTVNWTVCKELWDILPGAKRKLACDLSTRLIDPFFVKLVEDLLIRVELQTTVAALAADWSFEEIEQECSYGAIVWQVGQGVWDMMPADRRDNLILLMQEAIHRFFHRRVEDRLINYVAKSLP